MSELKGIVRHYIDIDWNKVAERHELESGQKSCFQTKWNPFRKNWEQGFDSDCAIHCNLSDSCYSIFQDKEVVGENHYKEIVVPMEEYPNGFDQRVEIKKVDRIRKQE